VDGKGEEPDWTRRNWDRALQDGVGRQAAGLASRREELPVSSVRARLVTLVRIVAPLATLTAIGLAEEAGRRWL
jgi:hypothetical protein